jgi:PAS domain S-box-containing protein
MGSTLSTLLARAHQARRDAVIALAESQQANERLQKIIKERQVFAALVENSSDFIGIADSSGKPVYLNPAGRRMVGLAAECPVENTQITEYYFPDQRSFASDVILKSMVEKGHWEGETYFRNWKTQEPIPVSDTHFMIREPETGEIIGMGTVTRDISDIQRARDLAAQNEARFHALVNASAQIVWTTDADGAVVEDSPSWRTFTGQTYEQLRGSGWLDALHPEDRERTVALWRDAIRSKAPVVTEHRIRHASGEWRWTSVRAVPLLRPDGSVKEWVGMNDDITPRKRAEAERHLLSEVSFILSSTIDYHETLASVARMVVRDLADCCIVETVEDDGHVHRPVVAHRDVTMALSMNAIERLNVNLRQTHLASSVLETRQSLLIPEVTPEYLSSVAQSEEHLRALQGLAPKSLIAVPLVAHRQMLGSLIFLRTSSFERYEPQGVRLAEELGARAALAVHSARLYRAALRATGARDEVLGVVAHDLRNPLNSIMMHAQLLQRGRSEGEARYRKHGESIHKSASRMNRLIQDLLDVTRIEAGQLPLERGPVAAEQVALDVVEAQKAVVASSRVELKLDVARCLPTISVDRDRLLQVFENLIGNAVKFTPSGGSITIGANLRGGEVMFWVEDTGAGIPAEHLPHLFDRFWQAKKGAKGGAGLGLAIARGVVDAHGGRIWVESTEGRGTTFYFTVPVGAGAEELKPAVLH